MIRTLSATIRCIGNEGVNLSGADLKRANFSGADLSTANLKNVKIYGGEKLVNGDIVELTLGQVKINF